MQSFDALGFVRTLVMPSQARTRVIVPAFRNRRCAAQLAQKQRSSLLAKQTNRGQKQDRARVAGGQDYEVRYEARKTGKSKKKVKLAVKSVGNSRRRVERLLSC